MVHICKCYPSKSVYLLLATCEVKYVNKKPFLSSNMVHIYWMSTDFVGENMQMIGQKLLKVAEQEAG